MHFLNQVCVFLCSRSNMKHAIERRHIDIRGEQSRTWPTSHSWCFFFDFRACYCKRSWNFASCGAPRKSCTTQRVLKSRNEMKRVCRSTRSQHGYVVDTYFLCSQVYLRGRRCKSDATDKLQVRVHIRARNYVLPFASLLLLTVTVVHSIQISDSTIADVSTTLSSSGLWNCSAHLAGIES